MNTSPPDAIIEESAENKAQQSFPLNKEESENLRFHFGTSSQWGGRRYPPYAFTEQGVAMLSSVLRRLCSCINLCF